MLIGATVLAAYTCLRVHAVKRVHTIPPAMSLFITPIRTHTHTCTLQDTIAYTSDIFVSTCLRYEAEFQRPTKKAASARNFSVPTSSFNTSDAGAGLGRLPTPALMKAVFQSISLKDRFFF